MMLRCQWLFSLRTNALPFVTARHSIRHHTATQRNMPPNVCDVLRASTYGAIRSVNGAVEINVLDYNVAVRCRTSKFGNVR